MTEKKLRFQIGLSIVMLLLVVASLSYGTYAWFSGNKKVNSNMLTARSANDNLDILLSSAGGDAFVGKKEIELVQVNDTDAEYLLPVSTADLKTFVTNEVTHEDMASYFTIVSNEENYYHGRIYLKATTGDAANASKMALYLDESTSNGGALVTCKDEQILDATRLGLVFQNDYEQASIFRFSEDQVQDGQIRNTLVNGTLLEDGMVVTLDGEKVSARKDPSILTTQRMVTVQDGSIQVPDQPLFVMDLNTVVSVDVYFYLEGCDPDCSDSVSMEDWNLHLAFFGVLQE